MRKKAEYLLINNNNTRTKFALAASGEVLLHDAMMSGDVSATSVREHLAGWQYEKVVLASVVPRLVPVIREALGDVPMVEVSHACHLGVEVDFPRPEAVGADRLANAAAVAHLAREGQWVVVVDFGTAVTFDIIDPRPAYVGGVIAPGLDAMRHYLHQKTALLPVMEIEKPASALGKSTIHAMQSGAYHGYRGLVKEILARIEEETCTGARVIATGGYSALIAEGLPEIHEVDADLTMRGLLRIAEGNF